MASIELKEINLIDNYNSCAATNNIKTNIIQPPPLNKSLSVSSLEQGKEQVSETSRHLVTTLRSNIFHRIKVGALFLIVTFATGCLFVGAREIATTSELRWWWQVDLAELIFQVAILTAIVEWTLKTAGGPLSYRFTIGGILFVWAVLLIVTQVAPESWIKKKNNSTKETDVNRGSCYSLQQTDGILPVVSEACFDETDDVFVQLSVNNSVVNDGSTSAQVEKVADAISRLQDLSASGLLLTASGKFDLGNHVGLLHAECLSFVFSTLCRDHFRMCRFEDCFVSTNCFEQEKLLLVKDTISCVKKKCKAAAEHSSCNAIDAASVAAALRKTLPTAQEIFNNQGIKGETGFAYLLEKGAGYFEQASRSSSSAPYNVTSSSCDDWQIKPNNNGEPKSSSSIFSSTNVSCNPAKTKFMLINEGGEAFDSSVLLACVLLYLTLMAMTMGKNYTHLKFQCSTVRSGSLLAAILMAALVYIGSTHLHDATNSASAVSVSESMLVWRKLYLFVSLLCFSGGLWVISDTDDASRTVLISSSAANDSDSDCLETCSDCSCCNCCSCCTRVGACILSCVTALKSLKSQFWDASGDFFWLKLVLMEVFEISIQLSSLATSATNSQVDEVLFSAWIIAANFVILPLAIMLVPLICSRLKNNASSSHVTWATVMVIEVLFDKLYVAVGVLLRADTLTDVTLSFYGQLTVHGALLLPALMTALDVQDALDLSDHMDTLREATSTVRQRSTIVRNISNKMNKVTQHRYFVIGERVGLVTSILLGLAFGTYTQYSVIKAKQECEQRIGSIASCADKKYYFAEGFFSRTTCAFHLVTSFDCSSSAEGNETIIRGMLPDAEAEYAKMTNLTHIHMRNSLLVSAPKGWAKVPSQLTIDLSNSKHLFQLPFVLCAFGTNLTNIQLSGTLAARALNWTGQLRDANVSNAKSSYLNAACVEELQKLPHFSTLLLNDNELTDDDMKRLQLYSFRKLT